MATKAVNQRPKPLKLLLRDAGYLGTLEEFQKILQDTLKEHYPGWTADDLVCRPNDALAYIRYVNVRSGCLGSYSLEHSTILKALLNLRKQKKLEKTRDKEATSTEDQG